MELVAILFLVLLFLGALKLLALIFKAGFFILSIPLQILGAIFLSILFLTIFPLGAITGLVTFVFMPLLIFGPLLPILLLAFIIYLLVK